MSPGPGPTPSCPPPPGGPDALREPAPPASPTPRRAPDQPNTGHGRQTVPPDRPDTTRAPLPAPPGTDRTPATADHRAPGLTRHPQANPTADATRPHRSLSGLFLYADLRRRGGPLRPAWWSGVCLGIGGFQLYDGTVQHKLLRLHQIRYDVDPRPYDWTWNVIAVQFLVAGLLLWHRARPAARERTR
ncbi:DUF2243 domain-containing protein [Streptomyces coeruleorubidus]|uniref:DUF2243 domain-containing protein n=1 Tax=Streptomyces coeruleorubidus TaxID=116188 RepID=UPI0033BC0ACC